MVNISFDHATMAMLKSLVGKAFEYYSCDPFIFTPKVLGIVGLHIGGDTYKLTSDLHTVERFFDKDEVAVMRITPCLPSEIISQIDDGQLLDTPVQDRIIRIDVVNDLEAVTHDGIRAELRSTKGVVFYLASGNEISFELKTWFSEMIHIRRGYGLVKEFRPLDYFIEEWVDEDGEEPMGCIPECKREVVTLD